MVGRPLSFWEDTFFRGYSSFREGSRLKHETSVCKQTSLLVMSLPLLPKRVEHVVFWKLLLCQYLSGTHKYASWTCHNFTYHVQPLQAETLRTNVHPHDFKTKTHRIIFANDKFKLFLILHVCTKKYMRRILNSAKNNTFPNLKVSGHFLGGHFPLESPAICGFSEPATWLLCPMFMVTSLPRNTRNTGETPRTFCKGIHSTANLGGFLFGWNRKTPWNTDNFESMSWNWWDLMGLIHGFCGVFWKKRDTIIQRHKNTFWTSY